MTFVNQTKFAKEIGKSKGYISMLKSAGRLVMSEDGRLVNVEESIKLIADTADQNRDDVAARHEAERLAKKTQGKKVIEVPAEDLQKVKFSEGRAKEQHFKALQAELDYKKTIGELVSKQEMQMAVTDLVMTFRQAIENLPHRISAELVGKDIDFIRGSLRQEITAALNDLQTNCRKKLEGEIEV